MHGVTLPTVKELLEHKTMAMTLRYAHLSSGYKHRAVRTPEQVCGESPSNLPNSADDPTSLASVTS
jgi:hypothetical protein